MGLSIKSKVLIGFITLTMMVLAVFAYGAWTFRKLERRMEVVNNLYVPTMKALNQIESTFFLLESDIDKSLHEGILRPKDSLESVLNSKLDFLNRTLRDYPQDDAMLRDGINGLTQSYSACEDVFVRVYQDWGNHSLYESELSQKRSDFRFRLKGLIQDLDRETRLVSVGVQSDISRLGIVLTVVVGLSFMVAFLMAYWLAISLKPLEILAKVIRRISEHGLSEEVVHELSSLPIGSDEVGMLSRESCKMASSLLDNNKLLQVQKQNLERARLDLAQQNEELKKTQNKLLHTEKLGLVGKMAAQMAHEIRNPLNALSLHAEILEQQLKDKPDILENLVPVQKEINRLINVTENYLDLSRGPKVAKDPVDLNNIVEELHELYEPLFKEKGIFFTCDLGDIPVIEGDRSQLMQVIGNLLKNASEAFEESDKQGARFIRLITQYLNEKKEVVLTLLDNGAGMPEELKKNVFSPFVTNKANGTGLGLAYSKQVLEAHGGEIFFESTLKKGTKFTLKMPVEI